MEEVKTNAGQGLGIAGLILGCVAIPLAILGCTSIMGLVLGATGVILSAVGLSQATRSNGNKGLPIGGLIVSILGTCIALMWLLFFARVATEGGKWWSKEGIKIMEEISEGIDEDLEEAFEDLGEELEEFGQELEEVLEDLEIDIDIDVDYNEKWGDEISEDEFDDVLVTLEDLLVAYKKNVKMSDEGNIHAMAEYIKISAKAMDLIEKIEDSHSELNEEQLKKLQELQQKFQEAIEDAGE